jgi:hypothetical protein
MLEFKPDPDIRCRDYRIGCIGAGFIMADVQLATLTSNAAMKIQTVTSQKILSTKTLVR